jgi:hypothetical protein
MSEQEEPVVLIVAGHYRMKSHGGEESKEIVRVLGPSPNRKGHWKTMEGRDMSEYELIENWEPLVTAVNQNQPTTNRLMMGLLPIADAERLARGEAANVEPEIEEEHVLPVIRTQSQPIYPVLDESRFLDMVKEPDGNKKHKLTIEENAPHAQQLPQTIENSFIASIFKKLIETTSDDIEPITVTFELPLPFDVERLKESMSLLDLDANEVVKHVVDRLLQKSRINNAISANLHQLLTEPKRGKSAKQLLNELRQEKPKEREIPYVPMEDRTLLGPMGIDAKAVLDRNMEAEMPKPLTEEPIQQAIDETLEITDITEISEEISTLEQKTAQILKKYIG